MPQRSLASFAPPRVSVAARPTVKYGISPLFDFELGDFVTDAAGRILMADRDQTWAQWAVKAVLTERFQYVIYPDNYGSELYALVSEGNPFTVEAKIRQFVKEALLIDSRILDVADFDVTQSGNGAYTVSVTVIPYTGTPEPLEVDLP